MHLRPINLRPIKLFVKLSVGLALSYAKIFRVFAILGLIFSTSACSGQDKLVLHTSKGEFAFAIELADTSETRARGLMFRQSLADHKGMLFDFKEEREVAFWMRNTFIALDMIFIAADGTIRHIHPQARPHDQTSISSEFPVRFVFEIAGGRAAQIGLAVGDRMAHPLVIGR